MEFADNSNHTCAETRRKSNGMLLLPSQGRLDISQLACHHSKKIFSRLVNGRCAVVQLHWWGCGARKSHSDSRLHRPLARSHSALRGSAALGKKRSLPLCLCNTIRRCRGRSKVVSSFAPFISLKSKYFPLHFTFIHPQSQRPSSQPYKI